MLNENICRERRKRSERLERDIRHPSCLFIDNLEIERGCDGM